MFDFSTSAIVVTALNYEFINQILNSFINKKHIPIANISKEEEVFLEMKEKIEKDGDTLHDIIYMIEYKKTFEA